MIRADYHVHSDFSSDSEAPMESMIDRAIELGLERICFTDHMDYDFPMTSTYTFVFEPVSYFRKLCELQEQYQGKIKILKGIELGLQPHVGEDYQKLIDSHPFDFIIGSTHLVQKVDPYLPVYWETHKKEEGIRLYFEEITENLKNYKGFLINGHLDYMIRYAPGTNEGFTYKKYSDTIDTMLRTIIESGKGIEINTSGFKYQLTVPHPHTDIIKRYKELGGELITIGSDAHKPEHLAYDFNKAEELLLELGFRYYSVFEEQKPILLPLGK
ncbi:histidinol-phosphatase HisJ family protein [Anaerocolumna sp. AGMB13020]|uniref:histidinol-phosphatase HisJ family protein n=1 Tax=Anaerocolumna sp. AGMB13020 TaxID=3081750 RepID=UPI0029533CE6|nr:histidinol-phosphatase HisJ family protein [Anaerocolumna sp. AGMB13020]WOO36758.1 histidinol-phosphatase HisJ family protein [Anaerocolumna sp. AGMB13020]